LAEELVKGKRETQQGDQVVQGGYLIEVDQAMDDAVQVYVDLARTLIATSSWWRAEQRVALDDYWIDTKPPVSIFGTADFLAYREIDEHLTVVDYKHGSGVFVNVVDNPQALAYAAGAMRLVPGPVQWVDIVIVQPNAPRQEKIRRWSISALDVLIWVDDVLIPGIARTIEEVPPIQDGAHCRFCPAAVICPLLRARSEQAAQTAFAEHSHLYGVELADQLLIAERAELWIKAIREFAQDKLANGEAIPGWSLTPTRPTRSWDDPVAVGEFLTQRGVDNETIFAPPALRSPAQMEKRVISAVWRDVAQHVQLISSGVKLTHNSEG
jgi:hypothetical protein